MLPNPRSLPPVLASVASPLSFRASAHILHGSRAGGRQPEIAKQPKTAEELEELRRPTGRRRPKVKRKPLDGSP